MRVIEHSGETCQVMDATPTGIGQFQQLNKEEVVEFRASADEQPDGVRIEPIWHPVFQDQMFINGKGVE